MENSKVATTLRFCTEHRNIYLILIWLCMNLIFLSILKRNNSDKNVQKNSYFNQVGNLQVVYCRTQQSELCTFG